MSAESLPLAGRRIVVTRARSQAGSLATLLASAGAEAIEMAATRIEALDPTLLRRALGLLPKYQWLVFTSQNAVELFWTQLQAVGLDRGAVAHLRVAVVGPATRDALTALGIPVEVTPDRFVAEGLVEMMARRDDVAGARVLYACAEGARDAVPVGLLELGATVDVVPIYRSVPDGEGAVALRKRLERNEVDLLTFTSASAIEAFIGLVGGGAAKRAPVASIGPVTTAAAQRAGLRVAVEATESTIPGLVAAITAHTAWGG